MKKSKDPIPKSMLTPISPIVTTELPLSGIGGVVICGTVVNTAGVDMPVGTITIGVEARVGEADGKVGKTVGKEVGAEVAVGNIVWVGA